MRGVFSYSILDKGGMIGMGRSARSTTAVQEEPGGCKDEYGGRRHSTIKEDNWCAAYKNSITTIEDLAKFIPLKEEDIESLRQVVNTYHMRIPPYFFSLIQEPENPLDPIRMQSVPSCEEIRSGLDEDIDPLGEEKTSPVPHLVHRYPDRVLLLVTGRCFMYCRHCTRKRLWREKTSEPTLKEIESSLRYVKANREIREVVISGGDPLTLPTERLDYILSAVAHLPNVEAIRIGTRAPVVLPQRVDKSLCAVLGNYDNLWINVQFNHPREITPHSIAACKRLQRSGIPISNQSVLLKGINDDPEIMMELCHKLQAIRVRPYYLFECDPVVGASHFRTSVFKGVEIIKRMRGYTSGMCIPTFVVDGIDGKGKVPLAPDYLVSASDEGVLLRNYRDELFFYHHPGKEVPPQRQERPIRTIGIVFNLKKNGQGDEEEEYDEPETIEGLQREIERCGFMVRLFEQNERLIEDLTRERPDFVFNIAEGIGKSRGRESQVPSILESLGIPYSGSDPIALGITLDKYLTNRILQSANLPVPLMYMAKDEEGLTNLRDIFDGERPFIVKPRWEGSSRGIFLNSVVKDFDELKERIVHLHSKYCQPALIEEFLEGEEITAAVCGNTSPYLLGMMKIVPSDQSQGYFLYSLETKREWETKVLYEPQEKIRAHIQALVAEYTLTAYRTLELKDFARIDFRVGKGDIPKIIDINPLPGLSPRYSDLPILYRLRGKSYSELIETLLKESFGRYGFVWQ